MAYGKLTTVVIYDQKLYTGKGLVNVWMRKVIFKFSREAKKAAPVRSGDLRRGIHSVAPRLVRPRMLDGKIYSRAPHTLAVLKGTTGPIYTNAGWRVREMAMDSRGRPAVPIGRDRMFAPVKYKEFVEGQTANNFFAVAWRRTGASYPALRGLPFPNGVI